MKNKDIDDFWKNTSPAFSNQYATILGIPLTPTGFFLQLRYKKISKILQRLPGKIMLDVGCGSGIFMREGILQGRKVVGIDYSKQMIETARRNLSFFSSDNYELIEATAQKIPLKNNSMDIVLASGLTDYLKSSETVAFMFEVSRVLKKNGYVIITFPKTDSPLAFLRSNWGLGIRKLFLKLPPLQTTYTKQEIKNICHNVSIEPIEWDEVLLTMRIMIGKKK